jgi:undecaprenyl-diphosphatase
MMSLVARFDQWVDGGLDRFRGNRVADRVFYVATFFGDFSLFWHLMNVLLVVCGVRTRKQAVRFACLVGVESLVVNQGIKSLFRRERPDSGDHPHHVRKPLTSSFPSGHASSAVFAATLLSDDHPRLQWLLWACAGTIATSRPYVRAHHGSDIVGGMGTGALLALLVRFIMRRSPRM